MASDPLHLIIWKQKSELEISDLDFSVTRYNYNKLTLKENLRCSIISREGGTTAHTWKNKSFM